ncbi:MAG: type I-C CRISPR-associated protein Cas5 [Candidatus Brocadia sp. UTAMX2]|jgi:CRISPR-associated protein Cas5d|nr:MAG: type I-C CRISPR-associated protein Cas5 [Candidatus Brocadia sp. UTAMX2]
MISEPVRIRIKGQWACFTRPEFHVERVSYPVITPSAARGVLEAILMKPIEKPQSDKRQDKSGFIWRILRIGIVKKGVPFSILRNELKTSKIAFSGKAGQPINVSDTEESHTQRHSLILKDVEYLIEAAIEVPEEYIQDNGVISVVKYRKIFERRVKYGRCFHRPYLGCREYPCEFEWDENARVDQTVNDDFGSMFHDFDFSPVWNHWGNKKERPEKWVINGKTIHPIAKAFYAKAEKGWITVSKIISDDGRKKVEGC